MWFKIDINLLWADFWDPVYGTHGYNSADVAMGVMGFYSGLCPTIPPTRVVV